MSFLESVKGILIYKIWYINILGFYKMAVVKSVYLRYLYSTSLFSLEKLQKSFIIFLCTYNKIPDLCN